MDYLVTTDPRRIPNNIAVVMIDGTVPGWVPREGDLHFDHHRPGGADIQIDEIPQVHSHWGETLCVTTQVDADACVAAAWIQSVLVSPSDLMRLRAIAYDCDHLGCPVDPIWDPFRDFARNAVAALKAGSDRLLLELGLTQPRKDWTAQQKEMYASTAFERGTQWILDALAGYRQWPGEDPLSAADANAYWANVEALRPYVEAATSLVQCCAVLDQRGVSAYVDPRLLVEIARERGARNVTLTVRDREVLDRSELRGYSYTLGSVPLHKDGSPKYSDLGIWGKLSQAENKKRMDLGFPAATSGWGGRNEVGGSPWNDASFLTPEDVIKTVLD